jgi:hypothetical protein
MRRHCQFTVKQPEKRVGLTVAPEQQSCGIQVVERANLTASSFGRPFQNSKVFGGNIFECRISCYLVE